MSTTLHVHPLTPDRWEDFVALFESMGTYNGCWCMWWRLPNKDYDPGEGNKERMRQLVFSGVETGLLAYLDDAPVGWVSLAPRTDYMRFARATAPTFRSPDELPVWSVVCFFVHPEHRKQGVAGALLEAAKRYAAAHAANMLEAYAVDLAVGKKPAAADLNMGTQGLFESAGFHEVARNKPNRPIMRLLLSPTSNDIIEEGK